MTIRDAIQEMLDSHDDGWSVTQHVVCMGLERVIDGRIESMAWFWAPSDQPVWMTGALIESAIRQHDDAIGSTDI